MYRKIKDLPLNERPYEKFIKYGPKALSDAELLAIILKTGCKNESSIDLARKVLKKPDGSFSLSSVFYKDYSELIKIDGIGTIKAINIKCVAELTERISKEKVSGNKKFDDPEIIASSYMERLRHLKSELVIAVFLDSSNSFIADSVISKGTINASLISARDIFIKALSYEAVKVILIHNHPSGNPTPSNADIEVTKDVIKAGKLLNINLADHIIIGDLNYISFREVGLIDINGNINKKTGE